MSMNALTPEGQNLISDLIDRHDKAVWNAAIEAAAKAAADNGDYLEIHSPRIAEAIRALRKD